MSWIAIAVGDTETTGLSQEAGHRIIEVAFSCWAYNLVSGDHYRIGKPYLQRINPQRTIDPHAEAVHGINLSHLRGKPTWDQVAPKVASILNKVDLFIAHNVKFDAPFIALELMRVGIPCPAFDVYCTMENGRKATGFGKVPNLSELCYATGVLYEPEKAHSAMYDVEVLEQAYWAGVESGLFKKPSEI